MLKPLHRGKKISHGGKRFPQLSRNGGRVGAQLPRKLQPEKVVAIQVGDPDRLGPKDTGGGG